MISDKHFSVDGTLIQASASHQSFQPKAGSSRHPARAQHHARLAGAVTEQRDAREQERSGRAPATDVGLTAQCARPRRLRADGRSRSGLVADACMTRVGSTVERDVALTLLDRRRRTKPISLAAYNRVCSPGRRLQSHPIAETTGRRDLRETKNAMKEKRPCACRPLEMQKVVRPEQDGRRLEGSFTGLSDLPISAASLVTADDQPAENVQRLSFSGSDICSDTSPP
jgi:hypothetical protein